MTALEPGSLGAVAVTPGLWSTAGWAVAGAIVGGALAGAVVPRLLTRPDAISRPKLVGGCSVTSGISVGILTVRFDGIELVAFALLACAGVVLSAIDLVERRLPGRLVVPTFGVVPALLAVEAAGSGRWGQLGTALAAAAVVMLAYLVLALASSGGLGSGDVRFGGLLAMATGWLGWPAVVMGITAAWTGAAAVLLILRSVGQRPNAVPMGPFLLGGALLALMTG